MKWLQNMVNSLKKKKLSRTLYLRYSYNNKFFKFCKTYFLTKHFLPTKKIHIAMSLEAKQHMTTISSSEKTPSST